MKNPVATVILAVLSAVFVYVAIHQYRVVAPLWKAVREGSAYGATCNARLSAIRECAGVRIATGTDGGCIAYGTVPTEEAWTKAMAILIETTPRVPLSMRVSFVPTATTQAAAGQEVMYVTGHIARDGIVQTRRDRVVENLGK